jgi:hypothetical protein
MTNFIDMSPIVFRALRPVNSVLIAVFFPILMCAADDAGLGVSSTMEAGTIGFEEAELDSENRSLWKWQPEGDVQWKTGLSGRAPHFSKEGGSVLIPLADQGDSLLDLREGSIRFRFRPDWNSGVGPGNWASFFSIGIWTPDPATIGYWSLGTDPTGKQISFSGQKVGGGRTFLRVPIQFQADRWYDMLLVYSASSSRLFIDGVELGPGNGVSVKPSKEAAAEYGMRIGNNHHGNQPIHGIIDELELKRAQRSGFDQRKESFSVKVVASTGPTTVELSWAKTKAQPEQVRRRAFGQKTWNDLGHIVSTNHFIDRSPALVEGESYEYLIGRKRIGVMIGMRPAVEHRGRVLLVIARDTAEAIEDSILQYTSDLVGDGWQVEAINVPENNMRRRTRYHSRVMGVKSAIEAFHHRAPEQQNVVVLIGNVPIPYSGFRAEDGHERVGDDHRGAWPCDAFYGDLDGEWTDESVDHINHTDRSNTNRPGDGKFDQDYLPSSLELAVGRIEFSNLPAIRGKSLPGRPISSDGIEEGLLRRYFEKNHRYRSGVASYSDRGVFISYLPYRLWQNMDRNAFQNSTALFGSDSRELLEEDCFLISRPVKWGFIAGYGGRQSLGSGRYQTRMLNEPEFGPKAAFLMLYSSWSGDWNLRDSFTKSMLVKPETGLAVMSSLHGQWMLGALALGEPLASAYLETAEERERGGSVARSMSILGDVTLRMDVVPPVDHLSGVTTEDWVQLTWASGVATENELGFYIYRSASKNGPYRRVSGESPVMAKIFVDRESRGNESFYMVRRAAVQSTPAGRYVNLSQGRFWSRGD